MIGGQWLVVSGSCQRAVWYVAHYDLIYRGVGEFPTNIFTSATVLSRSPLLALVLLVPLPR